MVLDMELSIGSISLCPGKYRMLHRVDLTLGLVFFVLYCDDKNSKSCDRLYTIFNPNFQKLEYTKTRVKKSIVDDIEKNLGCRIKHAFVPLQTIFLPNGFIDRWSLPQNVFRFDGTLTFELVEEICVNVMRSVGRGVDWEQWARVPKTAKKQTVAF